jgi:hypothetical protein
MLAVFAADFDFVRPVDSIMEFRILINEDRLFDLPFVIKIGFQKSEFRRTPRKKPNCKYRNFTPILMTPFYQSKTEVA